MIDLDITEMFGEVVRKIPEKLEILYSDGKGGFKVVKSPKLNYIFGSSQYIKDILDEYSKSPSLSEKKFPLVALFTPVNEDRGYLNYFSKADVSLIIACSSRSKWSNEERRTNSFKNILRPIYRNLLDVLCDDYRFSFDCDEGVKHSYSENYSYGRYGAYTDSGEAVSEPIDAINIRSMEIKINNLNCRRK
nr:MAG TPA: hypothetical protein [Caudoviricetes sp.]